MNNLETIKSIAVLELQKSLDDLIKYRNKLDDILVSIEKLNEDDVLFTKKQKKKFKLKKIYKKLNEKKELYNKHIKATNTAVLSEQKKCNHKYTDGSDAFEYEGHDSHHDYYVCKICGHEISV